MILALSIACEAPPADTGNRYQETDFDVVPCLPDLTGMNLVYIHADTLRKDHLPAHGYARNTLPLTGGLAWLGLDGVVGSSSWTNPSTATLLTAEPPEIHGIAADPGAGGARVELDVPTVAGRFREAGWATAAVSGNAVLMQQTDVFQAFDEVRYTGKTTDAPNLWGTVQGAMEWVDGVDGPFLLFLQPMDAHAPYWVAEEDRGTFATAPIPFDLDESDEVTQRDQIRAAMQDDPEGTTQALVDVYDEQLLGLDRGIALLLAELEARDLLAGTAVVLSGDHGETLNDAGDGGFGHGATLRGELVEVPWLLLASGTEGGLLQKEASNADLFPTLLPALGLPAWEGVDGDDLNHQPLGYERLPITTLWRSPGELGSISAVSLRGRVERDCADGTEFGYDLDDDPNELSPVDVDRVEGGDELHDAIEAAVARIATQYPGTDCPI